VTKRSSPTSWILGSDLRGEVLPAVPVVLGEAVFDGDDGVLASPVDPEVGHLGAAEFALVGLLEDVLAGGFVVELGRRGIECDGDVFTGLQAYFFDCFEISSMASWLDFRLGASPPSSPTAVL